MTRILFVGTSHLGALRLAWHDFSQRNPNVEAQFFGAQARTFRKADRLDGNRFGFTEDSIDRESADAIRTIFGGLDVDLGWADHIVLVGVKNGVEAMLDLCLAFDIDGLPQAGLDLESRPPMSLPVFDSLLETVAQSQRKGAFEVLAEAPRTIVVPAPLPSNSLRAMKGPKARQFRAAADWDMTPAVERLWKAFRSVYDRNGKVYLAQPSDTLDRGLTRSEFAEGSVRLLKDEGHPSGDHRHMNAAYGARVLDAVLAEIEQRKAVAAAG